MKKKFKIEFELPHVQFIEDAIFGFNQAVAYVRWQLNAPKCVITNKKLFMQSYDLWGTRIGFSKFCVHGGEVAPLSAEGFYIQLSKYLDVCEYKTKKCDCCGQVKPTIDIIWGRDAEKLGVKYLDTRFCVHWWNGHNLCKDCLLENAKVTKPRVNYIQYRKGKETVVNKQGMVMNLEDLVKSKLW